MNVRDKRIIRNIKEWKRGIIKKRKVVFLMNKVAILTITIVIGVVALFATPREINCVSCGEMFNNEHTVYEEMCDICFGWHECEQKILREYSEVE